MKNRNWDFLVYVHAGLLLWFLLFLGSLSLPVGGLIAGTLAIGNLLFMFVNIPLALFSFVLAAMRRFTLKRGILIVVLSVLNIAVSIAVWSFALSMAEMANKMSQMG